MLDIYHFKIINDRFGHQKGDIALRAIAEIVKKRLEKTDVFTRRSGDEFLILLSDTSGEQAALLAEDLRLSVAQAKIPDVDHLTASFGVSEYRAGDTVDSVVISDNRCIALNKPAEIVFAAKSSCRCRTKQGLESLIDHRILNWIPRKPSDERGIVRKTGRGVRRKGIDKSIVIYYNI